MADLSAVVAAAQRLSALDADALEVRLGVLQTMLDKDPALAEQAGVELMDLTPAIGLPDDMKALGQRILRRWNKELHGLVCGARKDERRDRDAVLSALSLGESAVIAAVAGILIDLRVPAPLAAALAPLIVKRFVWPARDELCQTWADAIKAAG